MLRDMPDGHRVCDDNSAVVSAGNLIQIARSITESTWFSRLKTRMGQICYFRKRRSMATMKSYVFHKNVHLLARDDEAAGYVSKRMCRKVQAAKTGRPH